MLTLLTIAGSDSGGGAGIQADLKTFAALGAHGVSVITATTAQNTLGVKHVHHIPTEHVAAQLEAVLEDFDIRWAKTGMLPTEECIELVARHANELQLVVDPVVYAQSGARLIGNDALKALMELLTRCAVATPNIREAEMLSGIRIRDERDVLAAGNALLDMGVPTVVITGGHLSGSDYLFSPEGTHEIGGNLIEGGTHGSGCTYSAALAFYLASGLSMVDACERAKRFVVNAIRFSHSSLGGGTSPVNQMGELRMTAERYTVLSDVRRAVGMLTSHEGFASLIPEVGSNIGMAIELAENEGDVAAVCGRIVRARGLARACGDVEFGASGHVARMILAAMKVYPDLRAAMNIRYSEPVLDACMDMGLTMGSFSRKDEPEGVSTMEWGITSVLSRMKADVVYDGGDVGKEPMVRLFGRSATEVAKRALRIAQSVRR
ncbi:bifunctional hydroxymethylpyrimidine kinase/phosphomethylpyrimidine kinase [Methermicoccus shengliensis]|uniref:Bifunctional hydroxymethylpyrimidine kinase/phosphomethylpyrimidine kinase n=1 Tax=Methermicoccus shengliensis TaxID=660064 RepID=A0A832RVB5_9EURY|nr:bifunctional hydroxymethylpyrimidine kinase/phosphomethylpyrimidine kinase [Methermicoccus shengliensis]KUK05013.1 MAG: Phosphomethylpyrimidine kinase [Euryarchaeota archaeon 55_53]KUK30223.1 MAG: Phosphomethylpyrimidine kinase [Methanosarcinales archeaon 56_1174]MDI3487603.1 hydroxymethylpyrimidine kinase / phosphomethylpyrimidine kinase / thiamine-phosphate diphosphorylase [Methanosarcinales archaeon]MDN5294752.1 hydroxymethylpyrimidine kinase / phosphomethylpyrimidine kinase / thiamine-ph